MKKKGFLSLLLAGLMALCLGSNLVTKWRKNRP